MNFLPENLVKTGFNFGYCENMINSVRLQCFDKCARFRLFDIMFRYDLLWRSCVGLYTRTENIVSHSITFCKLSSKTHQQFVSNRKHTLKLFLIGNKLLKCVTRQFAIGVVFTGDSNVCIVLGPHSTPVTTPVSHVTLDRRCIVHGVKWKQRQSMEGVCQNRRYDAYPWRFMTFYAGLYAGL